MGKRKPSTHKNITYKNGEIKKWQNRQTKREIIKKEYKNEGNYYEFINLRRCIHNVRHMYLSCSVGSVSSIFRAVHKLSAPRRDRGGGWQPCLRHGLYLPGGFVWRLFLWQPWPIVRKKFVTVARITNCFGPRLNSSSILTRTFR